MIISVWEWIKAEQKTHLHSNCIHFNHTHVHIPRSRYWYHVCWSLRNKFTILMTNRIVGIRLFSSNNIWNISYDTSILTSTNIINTCDQWRNQGGGKWAIAHFIWRFAHFNFLSVSFAHWNSTLLEFFIFGIDSIFRFFFCLDLSQTCSLL
jgi:hypothetical protein